LPQDKVKRYIFISSDSIYEVCEDKIPNENGVVILNEVDAKRPDAKYRRKFLKELDSYGHHKLK
jgi:hypothetical protein